MLIFAERKTDFTIKYLPVRKYQQIFRITFYIYSCG